MYYFTARHGNIHKAHINLEFLKVCVRTARVRSCQANSWYRLAIECISTERASKHVLLEAVQTSEYPKTPSILSVDQDKVFQVD